MWLGMLPVNITTSWMITTLPWWGDVALPARSLLVVSIMAPLMTCIMMPFVTRVLKPWLLRHPGRARHERCLCEALDRLAESVPDQPGAGTARVPAGRISWENE